MGASSYNRGSKVIARDADTAIAVAASRAERSALHEENARLRDCIADLERDLGRARRCIAELRRSKDERIAELRADISRGDFAIKTLCRLAFPKES